MAHEILEECQVEFKEINEKIDCNTALTYEIKDNDLKHVQVGLGNLKGKVDVVLIVMSCVLAGLIGIIIKVFIG